MKKASEKILQKYSRPWTGEEGKMDATLHRIEVKPDALPVILQPYRAGTHLRDEIEEQVKKMLMMNFIEPSDG